jgi:hypothetical protein
MAKLILEEEGLSGFYGGVYGVMIGQGKCGRNAIERTLKN